MRTWGGRWGGKEEVKWSGQHLEGHRVLGGAQEGSAVGVRDS